MRTLVPLGSVLLFLAAAAARAEVAPEPTPEQLKQRLREFAERIKQDDEYIKALSERIKEDDKRATALRMIGEELAMRLDVHEKGAMKEFQDRVQPEALNRLLQPVASANVGDWVQYLKTVVAPDGTKTETAYKLSVAAKDKGAVTFKVELEHGGKHEVGEQIFKGPGPIDVFDPDGKQRRERKGLDHETINVGLVKYACIKATFDVSTMDGEKAVPAGERVCWINLTVPLTGFAMAVHTAPDGEKTTFALLGFGNGK